MALDLSTLAAGQRRVSEEEILRAWAVQVASPFRRSAKPTRPHAKAPRLQWRWTDEGDGRGAWHVWAGRFDLYVGIHRRMARLLSDPALA